VTPSKAVVLAREPGVSAESRPHSMPALASVGNRALVRHALDWLDRSAVEDVAIVTPADAAQDVRQALDRDAGWGFETRWLEQRRGERFADSLAALADFLGDEPFVLHLADSLSKHELGSLLGSEPPADDEALLVVPETPDAPEVIDLGARRGQAGACHGSSGVAVIGPAIAQAGAALDAFPQAGLEVLSGRVHELGGRVRTRTAEHWWR
jgi:hypothetical protein